MLKKLVFGLVAILIVLIGVAFYTTQTSFYAAYTHVEGKDALVKADEDDYYLYFYSETCHFCQGVKKYMDNYAADKEEEGSKFYLVESDSSANMDVGDGKTIIEAANEEFGIEISGTPTIVHVVDGKAEILPYTEELESYGYQAE